MGDGSSSETLERKLWRGEWELLLGNLNDFHDKLHSFVPRSLNSTDASAWQTEFCEYVGRTFDVQVKFFVSRDVMKATISSWKCARPISFRFSAP